MAKTTKQNKKVVKRCNHAKVVQLNMTSLRISPPRYSNTPNQNIVATNPCTTWKNSITFRRVGDNNTMYLFQLQRNYNRTSFPKQFDAFLRSPTPQSEIFRANTNILCPLLSMRNSPQDDTTMISYTGSPVDCLFSIKPLHIQHEQCVQCVMQTINEVIIHANGETQPHAIDMKELDGTNYLSLNCYLTDQSVQTIIYYYFYTNHLTCHYIDTRSQRHILPRRLTNDFANDNNDVASNFFAPVLCRCSETAKLFGYSDPISSGLHHHTVSHIHDYSLHEGYESI